MFFLQFLLFSACRWRFDVMSGQCVAIAAAKRLTQH